MEELEFRHNYLHMHAKNKMLADIALPDDSQEMFLTLTRCPDRTHNDMTKGNRITFYSLLKCLGCWVAMRIYCFKYGARIHQCCICKFSNKMLTTNINDVREAPVNVSV
jgi:hypothetical protein